MHEHGDALLTFAIGMMSLIKGMEEALEEYSTDSKAEDPELDDPDIITSTYEEITEEGDVVNEK